MGTGKSTLAIDILQRLSSQRQACRLLELDIGTPPFGVPGAPCIGRIENTQLIWDNMLPLCTLNSVRFRLPLIIAAGKLLLTAQSLSKEPTLLIDPPGVVRGVGGAELLTSLAEFLKIDAILVLCKTPDIPLKAELSALSIPFIPIAAPFAAKRPTKTERAKWRTRLWDNFLRQAKVEEYDLRLLNHIGTPPPCDVPDEWRGKQIALLDTAGEPVGVGEALELVDNILTANIVISSTAQAKTLLIRDTVRNATGHLATITPVMPTRRHKHVPADMGIRYLATDHHSPPLSCHTGAVWATLIGGVFGDPLLHVRFRNKKRSFLFDLGAPARLQAKIAHQVEAVFLSHTHLDHIGGFIWFLRSRLGPFGPCRIFGPEGTIERLEHFIEAITWDRIADLGPIFDITEIRNGELVLARLQPGRKSVFLERKVSENNIIMTDDTLNVRAEICDHKIPSIAYALELVQRLSIRKERLHQLNLPAGPWLGHLKQCIATQDLAAPILLPNGSTRPAKELAEELVIVKPGKKLVYAADMADNQENRNKMVNLARGAHTLFCEAAFANADKDKATATQHLTTIATAQIARSAGVMQLVPFHFSKRYELKPQLLYEEICAEAGNIRVIGAQF
ncbi:Clp1/GlmU family protein [Desulfosediminicola flagellatus]|uniref:Clp1/GlmU family protein n=1 Tax=Desulfosediminicola flagellatus TaxID=2569541 RepID=UPI0010AD2527|nr:Clp1/GlmU family protein [Desulfosediminicola flagellatus]